MLRVIYVGLAATVPMVALLVVAGVVLPTVWSRRLRAAATPSELSASCCPRFRGARSARVPASQGAAVIRQGAAGAGPAGTG
jgi:hypothetical protein